MYRTISSTSTPAGNRNTRYNGIVRLDPEVLQACQKPCAAITAVYVPATSQRWHTMLNMSDCQQYHSGETVLIVGGVHKRRRHAKFLRYAGGGTQCWCPIQRCVLENIGSDMCLDILLPVLKYICVSIVQWVCESTWLLHGILYTDSVRKWRNYL